MSLEKTVDVKFPSEKDKVAYSDVIKGFDHKTYKFLAKKGQHLQILLSNEWSEHIHISLGQASKIRLFLIEAHLV